MKNREKVLIKNTMIISIGIFCTKLVTFVLLPLYTYKLTTEEYGTVELFNTIISFLLPLLTLQVEQAVFRFLIDNRNNNNEIEELISSALFFMLIILTIISLCFIPFSLLVHNRYKWLILLVLISSCFSTMFMQISRGLGDNRQYSISSILTAIFSFIFTVVFLFCFNMNINGVFFANIIGYLSGIIYLLFYGNIYKKIKIKLVKISSIKKMIRYSAPMVPNALSWWIFSSSDRVIVSSMIGLSATGFLSIAYKFSNIAIIIYNIFNMSLTESISLHINDDDISEYYNNIFSIIGQLFVSASSLIISFMPLIFNILINVKFKSAYALVPFAIVSTEFQVFVGMLGTLYVAKNDTASIAFTSIISALINIIINLMFINIIGLSAAILSTVISYLFLFIYRLYDINKKYFRVELDKKIILNLLFSCSIVSILSIVNNVVLNFINILITLFLFILFNKNNISFIIRNFLKR